MFQSKNELSLHAQPWEMNASQKLEEVRQDELPAEDTIYSIIVTKFSDLFEKQILFCSTFFTTNR